jgi:hypothetical protein
MKFKGYTPKRHAVVHARTLEGESGSVVSFGVIVVICGGGDRRGRGCPIRARQAIGQAVTAGSEATADS